MYIHKHTQTQMHIHFNKEKQQEKKQCIDFIKGKWPSDLVCQ